MKKLLSVIIAVCALATGISVSAATSSGALSKDAASRNNKEALGVAGDNGAYADATALPAFRAGDILEFNVTGLTPENQLTLISYKYGDNVDIGNSTIQYINQYTLDAATQTIRYKIRDIEDGIYKISLNGNDGTGILQFFYKVGTPDVSMVKGANNKNYVVSKDFKNGDETVYSIAFVAQATIGSGDVSFKDIGLESLGLQLQDSEGKTAHSDFETDQIPALLESAIKDELQGAITIYYGLTIYNIPADMVDSITATPRLDGVAISAE